MTQVPTITLNDGTTIPQLGFGVWQVSGDDIVDAVSTALEVGYRHIDTAAIYGNEEGVGEAIKKSGIARDELFVTTKLWNNRHDDAKAALTESLGKLGLDHVDLYLTHWPVPQQDKYLEAWLSMEKLQAEGLTRSIGVSNHQKDHLEKVLDQATVTPAVNQIEIHPTFAQRELVAFNDSHGIRTEAWSPLGQAQDLESDEVTSIAEAVGRTPGQVVLRWHIQRGLIVFPKSVTPERIRSNFAIFDFELSADQMKAIDGLDAGNRIGADPDTMNNV
ncbi:aldo/keto reductase [Mariniluteicoccus flavus]